MTTKSFLRLFPAFCVLIAPLVLSAAIPTQLEYQGRFIPDLGAPPSSGWFKFQIRDAGAADLLTTPEVAVEITLSEDGYFSHPIDVSALTLGDLASGARLYVWYSETETGTYTPIVDGELLSSVPFALRAGLSDEAIAAASAASGSALETDISTLQSDLNTAEGSISVLQNATISSQATIGMLQTDVGTLQTTVGTLGTDVGTLQSDLSTAQSDLGTVQTDVGTLQTTVGTLGTDVGTLQSDLSTAQSDLGTVQTDVDSLQTDVGALQTTSGTLQTDVSTLQTDVGTLQTTTSTLQTDVSTLQTDMGTVQTNVGTLQTDVGTLQTDVGTLQGDVTTLESDVSSLQSGLGTAQGNISTLQTDVGTLQSTSSTLENDVTSLQQSLSLLTSRVTDLENSGGGAFTFPVLNVDPIVQVSAGESLSHAVFAYYASFVSIDNRGGASTSLKLSDASGGNDNYGGFLTWNPGNSDVGVYTVTLSASNESQQTATTTNITVAVAPADMVYLAHSEGGSLATFWMGDPFGWEFGAESDESPRHEVELSPFYIDRYEVSKAFWETIRASASTYGYSSLPSTSSNQKPMSNVDWFESIAWCNLRSEVEGLDIVYFTDSSLTTPYRNAGTAPVIYKDFSANGYRLPTEAEWEYAARGGIDGARYSWGNTDPSSVVMNAFGLFNGTLDVDDPWILPNNYGLMHITGNVAEWVWDYYQSSYYTFSPDTNPSGPTTGSVRGHRGGAYNTASAEDLLASNRSSATPTQGSASRGFRTVREP